MVTTVTGSGDWQEAPPLSQGLLSHPSPYCAPLVYGVHCSSYTPKSKLLSLAGRGSSQSQNHGQSSWVQCVILGVPSLLGDASGSWIVASKTITE